MPGFLVNTNGVTTCLRNYDDSRCIRDSLQEGKVVIQRNTLNKFLDDKVCFNKEGLCIVIEGIVYNYEDFKSANSSKSNTEIIFNLYAKDGLNFLNMLRGEFSGVIFDSKKQKIYIFTSKLGSKAVFYFCNGSMLIAGSQLNYVTDYLSKQGIKKTLDNEAIRQFLAYGYYLDDSTCVESVKRIYPGHYIEFDVEKGTLRDCAYSVFDYVQQTSCDEDKAIKGLHDSFLNAMNDVLKKNDEYNYKTLLDISGGADSRMICCTAKELKANDVLLDCYAQTNSQEIDNAQKVADLLGYDLVFHSLDSASSLMHIDDFVFMNNGATIYYGITGGRDMLEMLDQNRFGLECTGLLGDVYDGSMVVHHPEGPIVENNIKYRCSHMMGEEEFKFPEKMRDYFKNHINEHYWFYTRGMIFGMTSYFIRQNFTEAATPFGDETFIKQYLSLPWNDRVNKHLLRKWLIKYYPEAAEIYYSNDHFSIRDSITFKEPLITFIQKVFFRIRRLFPKKSPRGMNDYVFWYKNNPKFKAYIDGYYNTHIDACEIPDDIKDIIQRLNNYSIKDKFLAVTVLSMIKQYVNC